MLKSTPENNPKKIVEKIIKIRKNSHQKNSDPKIVKNMIKYDFSKN